MKLLQIFPKTYYSEYETEGHKKVAIWKMWFGCTYDIKKWTVVQATSMNEDGLDRILLKFGTLIHLGGLPFRLESDTIVLGRIENYKSAKKLLEEKNKWSGGICRCEEELE
jgi:hypothetical protein